tara:strand:- start:1914 stop:3824 length:1911 start_codon:yes stop_codon:yes gene_type:complete
MPLQLLKFNPGVVKDITEYAAGKNGPFWVDSDLVRFKNGYPEKLGGWQKDELYEIAPDGDITTTETTIEGIARRMLYWRAAVDGVDRLAVGTHNHLLIIQNGAIYDITPLRATQAGLTNPVATANLSATVTITDTAHGALTGDWVVLSGTTATGGITADTFNYYYGYQITRINADSYTIVVPTAASSTVAAGGGTVTIKYLIGLNNGLGVQSAAPALGWGAGGWGNEGWGTPRSASESNVSLDNSSWNLSLWGEDLLATARGAAVYYYDTSGGIVDRAVLVSSIAGAQSVPSVVRVSTVSFPDRHFIAGGCQAYAAAGNGEVDNMLVRWSSQEEFTKFAPTAVNTAGDQRLEIGTKIVAMTAAREETIISTDEAIYGMTFIGGDFVFSFRLLATDSGAAGLNAMLGVDGDVYWMGKRNFFKYDGIVQELPCPVQYYVADRLQTEFIEKTTVGHNKEFKEITWFYVSNDNPAGTTNPEPDSYVTFNYAENCWSVGTMDRTVWSDSFGARVVPFAFDPSGYLYNQETGTSADGAAMNSYIEGAPREISQDGETLYMVDQVIPDVTMTSSTSLALYMNTRKFPNSTEVTKGPFTITSTTDKVSTRAKGRQISLKFQSTGTQDDWTLGDFRVNSRQDGLR